MVAPRLFLLSLSVLLLSVPTVAAQEEEGAATARFAGADRFATAAEVATRAYDAAEHALVARGGDFPDALAAAPLAGALEAPIVLTRRSEVPRASLDALERLGVRRTVLLGGPAAIDEDVERQLRDAGYEVERIAGHDRYHTAIDIAREVGASDVVWLASGETFPDALAAGPPTANTRQPLLLTPRDRLPDDVEATIGDLRAQRVVIVGGPAAVSQDVQQDIEEGGVAVTRLAGRDRTDTAVQVAGYAADHAGIGLTTLLLARGDAFPDALAAAPYGAVADAPVLLTRSPDEISYDLLQFTVGNAETIRRVVALGGTAAVTDRVLARVAESAKQPLDTVTYHVGVADEHGDVDADVGSFAEHADWTLVDQRGWALDNDYRFTRTADRDAADFRLWLASPEDVDAAAPGCSPRWSCRVGDDVYINVERWNGSTETWDHRPLDDYRHYVVIHEVGHWIGLGHHDCEDSSTGEAPVMQQQSISLDGCSTNIWPLPFERELARDHLGGGSSAQGSGPAVSVE